MPWEWYLPFVLIPAIWAGVCVVIAKCSGWKRLTERFMAEREPDEGVCFHGQYLRLGWCDDNGCLTIRVSPDGLSLAVWPIFVGHAPLLIPWSELTLIEERPRRFFAVALFEVSQPAIAKLQLPLRVLDAGRQWRRPAPVE